MKINTSLHSDIWLTLKVSQSKVHINRYRCLLLHTHLYLYMPIYFQIHKYSLLRVCVRLLTYKDVFRTDHLVLHNYFVCSSSCFVSSLDGQSFQEWQKCWPCLRKCVRRDLCLSPLPLFLKGPRQEWGWGGLVLSLLLPKKKCFGSQANPILNNENRVNHLPCPGSWGTQDPTRWKRKQDKIILRGGKGSFCASYTELDYESHQVNYVGFGLKESLNSR